MKTCLSGFTWPFAQILQVSVWPEVTGQTPKLSNTNKYVECVKMHFESGELSSFIQTVYSNMKCKNVETYKK